MSRVIVVVDMEGATGIVDRKECARTYPEYYKRGVVQLTHDVNAVSKGLKAGGIEDIVVCDMHGRGQNILKNQLDPHIKLVNPRLHDLDKFLEKGCDGVVLLCFHAMAGTPNGFVSHTLIPFLRVRVNGQSVGETALVGWLCGTYDVPIVMVTGDEACIEEAEKFLPGVSAVAVKKAKNREVAHCFPQEEMRRLIEETAMATAKQLSQYKVYRSQEPILMEAAFRTPDEADLVAAIPRTKKTTARVVAYQSEKYSETFKFLSAATYLVVSSWFDEPMQKLTATDEGQRIFEKWDHPFREEWMREPQSLWYE